MVERLCALGWSVVACDIDPVRQQQALAVGAELADTPGLAAAALADDGVLIVCVVDAAQSHDVLLGDNGALAAMRPGQAVLLCPTIAPQDTEALAARLTERGIGCIDAPMSGGPARARDGSMSLMLAGPAALLELHADLLQALSSRRFVISERVGDGARTKLVNNLLAGINLVGAAEVLALAERLGLDVGTTLDVIEQSSGQSWIGSDRMRRAIAGDFEPRAHLTLLEKDTRLGIEAARAAGFEGPLGARAAEAFAQARATGLAGLDDGALLLWLRQRGI
ncbi:MAG: NAD(P)-dependent oxidoreductase [Hydrogenophaga sp.]|nr:NAD(P)-dependent oxidoreductase [Hydrogenophaga sp.]